MKKKINLIQLAAIIVLLFIAIFIANNNPLIKTMTQNTTKTLLDMNFNSSVEYTYGYLDDLGTSGRQAYRNFLIMFDMIFPVAYSALFFLILLFIKQRINEPGKIISILLYFPFAGGLLDIIENIHILVMLKNYPSVLNTIAKSQSLITSIKSAGSVVLLFIIACFAIIAIVKRKRGES